MRGAARALADQVAASRDRDGATAEVLERFDALPMAKVDAAFAALAVAQMPGRVS